MPKVIYLKWNIVIALIIAKLVINRWFLIGKDNVRNFPEKLLSVGDNEEEIAQTLFQELLWIDAKDVW